MNFDKNLCELRNRAGLSQEALAEKLGVSRQTIYKWETGQTYPDTDKLSEIAKLFDVSVDSMLEELDEEQIFTKEEIVKKFHSFGLVIGLSVMAIIFGVSIMLLFGTVIIFENSENVGLVIMLAIIFASVIAIVIGSMNFENFKKEDLHIEFSKKEIRTNRSTFTKFLVIGLVFIFLGVISLICMAFFGDLMALIGVILLLDLVGIGVFLITKSAIVFELYDTPDKALCSSDKRPYRKTDAIPAVIMLLATGVFLVLGFACNLWNYSWIAFPVGGILCGVSAVIFNQDENDNEKKD